MRRWTLGLGLLAGGLLAGCERHETVEGDAQGECNDLVDNDQDGRTDCDDPGCADSLVCTGDPGAPADADADGHEAVEAGGDDCDDTDPDVHPGAAEVPWSGRDEDCDPATPDDDLDGDGVGVAEDCDEADPAVGAGAAPACRSVGAADAVIHGSDQQGELGASSVFLPDVDGDGVSDLLVGVPGSAGGTGAVLLYGGATLRAGGDLEVGDALAVLTGARAADRLGDPGHTVVRPAGQGVALALPNADPGGFSNAGVVVLVGPAALATGGPVLDVATTELQGRATGDRFGLSVGGGDVDGDGVEDLLVSSPQDDGGGANAGLVAVFSGADLAPGTRSVEDADIALWGVFDERLGQGALAVVGDVDGDGTVDLAVGSTSSDALGLDQPGVVYLVPADGLASGPVAAVAGATLVGAAEADLFGGAVAGPGDWDGDGTDELVVGAARGEASVTNEGTVGLWWGGPHLAGVVAADSADLRWAGGTGLSGLGDALHLAAADGDGVPDLVFGVPDPAGSPRAYLLAGADAPGWTGSVATDAAAWITAAAPAPPLEDVAVGTVDGQVGVAAGLPSAGRGSRVVVGEVHLFFGLE